MKKKVLTVLLIILAIVLFCPIPKGVYKDGGTREYSAAAYKIIKWNRITDSGIYTKSSVYFFPYSLKSVDGLWEKEKAKAGISDYIPDNTEKEVHRENYNEEWITKSDENKDENNDSLDIVITDIYADCFFGTPIIPLPYTVKVNAQLDDKWCVGDKVCVNVENVYYDGQSLRMEADLVTIKESTFEPDPDVCYKPVIYLYPEKQTDVSLKLELNGRLTCTYPKYNDGWRVTAYPDSVLKDASGQTYNYLYWEGETYAEYDLSHGFCVKGEDTAAFLEYALSSLGLTRKEANEFIVYWLEKMENNRYNIISFAGEEYTEAAKLEITPAPDTLIRVFMVWQASDEYVSLPPQKLEAPERNGFTVVEWGATQK